MSVKYSLNSVRKYYGARLALDVDELALLPGRLYVLTGPNGSGKSTLLSILAFLLKPDSGEIAFAGNRVTWNHEELFPLRKKVTLLHQSPYLFSGTVFGNVAFGLKARGLKGVELQHAVSDALRLVRLAEFEPRSVKHLSGGEAQRVALARALALKPEVLLVDEPLASVDKASAEVVETVLASLPAAGTTVVMSTHDHLADQRLNGEVIRLLEGRIEQASSELGTTAEAASPHEPDKLGPAEDSKDSRWSASKMRVN